MKKHITFLAVRFATLFALISPVHAQIPVTDIANMQQQVMQYAQMGLQYTRQGLQLQNELKNLMSNPLSLLGPEVGGLINGVGSIMSATNAIGGNLAQINRNFDSTFKGPNNLSLAANFTRWHQTSTSTLEGALKAAGMHRDQFATDTDALTAIYNKSQAAGGNLQALQSLAEINAMQVQQTQKLQDLIATQNIAMSTYMAAQTAKDEAVNLDIKMITKKDETPRLKIGTTTPIKWHSILLNK